MSKNVTENNLATDAKSVLQFWEEHPNLKLVEATCTGFKKAQSQFQTAADEVDEQNKRLQLKMSERDVLAQEVKLTITRLRSAVRGIYGPDSQEYQQVGGVRSSDRKRPTRQKAAEAVSAGTAAE